MKHEKDEYEFPLEEWDWNLSPVHAGNWVVANEKIILTRKKPKVKVEYQSCGWSEWCEPDGDYGEFYLVQFRVTGFAWKRDISFLASPCKIHLISNDAHPTEYYSFYGIEIRPDANGQWSAPVLLPESIFSRLDEITKALEDRANGGKG